MQGNESVRMARGFNYSGSWGSSGLDLWEHHDHGAMAVEVARGKAYFPGWNVARWWLSHEAFQRHPERFLANLEVGLRIFAEHDIQVIPLLFNRWRDPICDFGGVPLDHIIPGASSYCRPGAWESLEPLTVGNYNSLPAIRLTEPLSDFISFHPYYIPNWGERTTSSRPLFEGFLEDVQAYAASVGKPDVLASETVWGANDDEEHVELIRYTVTELVRRDIGWVIHALNHSLVADPHSTAYGPVGRPGRLEFVNADGTLRRGHEVFNELSASARDDAG